jgi:hypothetical protein
MIYTLYLWNLITVAARSKAWIVFATLKTGVVGLNPIQGMAVSVCVYYVFMLSCLQIADLRRAVQPAKKSYPLCIELINWKKKPIKPEQKAREQP